ncbi:class I SAM-dependent methyltransferase [Cohnella hongkongensis]|uniref:Class I SAM-dependent methyltransferase n=1 Tax=Cohnella hongkongensis TaxID=178337 RepID=A0ABV9FAK0_9BACL
MMAATLPDRVKWAVDALAIAPSDRVLEIGCGHGTAVSLICGSLTDGSVTAIDQSDSMIRIAEKKNAEHIAAGRAKFITASLHEADLNGERFHKIFAINVNLFWTNSNCGLDIIKESLLPGGALYVFNQPPAASKLKQIAERTESRLISAGFAVRQMIVGELAPVPAVGVVAQLDDALQYEMGSENE